MNFRFAIIIVAFIYLAGCSKKVATITPPIAPSNLTIIKSNGARPNYYQLDLKWSDNSNDETGFIVEGKSVFNGYTFDFYEVITLNANSTSTSLVYEIFASEMVYFRVYAVSKEGGKSSYSNEVLVMQ